MRKYLLLILFLSQSCLSKEICTNDEISRYQTGLRNAVVSRLTYPRYEVMRGLEGDGLINLEIVNGEISKKQIVQSTGNRDFDLAIEAAMRFAVFPQLSCYPIFRMNVNIPIHFRLGPVLKSDTTSE